MNAWDELVARCARRRNEKIGPLSDEAYAELVLAVRQNPVDFVDAAPEQALLLLARALDARCYEGGSGRTHFHEQRLARRDAVAALVTVMFVAALALLGALPG